MFSPLFSQKTQRPLKIALVADWLVTYAGAERVLEEMLTIFPEADVFAVVDFLPAEERHFLKGKTVTTTFIQKLPLAKKHYRSYLPLMPLAIEQLDLRGYDVILSSHHAVAKGVLASPDQLHLCFCHSPMRYAWDLQHQYLEQSNLTRGLRSWVTRYLLHKLRLWDFCSASRVDHFIAISHYIQRRIEKTYRRTSTVIYPPVSCDDFPLHEGKEDFYLAASRLVPYKRMDLIVEAFAKTPKRRLVVIGAGPDLEKLRKMAPANVSLMGWQPFSVLRESMQKAKAFIFAAEEDFGIIPLEAASCGTPVIAYAKGGACETLTEGLSALFFKEQTPQSLLDALERFESRLPLDASKVRDSVSHFDKTRFRHELYCFVKERWDAFC